MPTNVLYGYSINECIEFRPSTGLLININDGRICKLANTNKRLLHFIIERSWIGWVCDNDIAEIVFESEGLRFSASRLRGVIRCLRSTFADLGYHSNFIRRNSRRGYYIDFGMIKALIAVENGMELQSDFVIHQKHDSCASHNVFIKLNGYE